MKKLEDVIAGLTLDEERNLSFVCNAIRTHLKEVAKGMKRNYSDIDVKNLGYNDCKASYNQALSDLIEEV